MAEPASILVVDDDEGLREMIAAGLSLEGYAATALPADEALTWLETHWPAAIVVDLRMWPLNGVDFLEEVQIRCGRVPPTVIATAYLPPGETAIITARVKRLAQQSAVVTKPFLFEELSAAVRQVLEPAQ